MIDVIHVSRMARIDGCHNCVENTEPPRRVEDDGDGGFFAYYRCTDCGYAWRTGWADEEN